MNKLLLFAGLFAATTANAQTAVQQTGPITNNSAVMWATDHHIRQAAGQAGDVAGKMITGGFSAVGDVCAFSNTTNLTHHKLCLNPGSGSISYDGSIYPINAGGGNVTGPSPTTPGNIAFWNNTTGTLLNERGFAYDGTRLSVPTGKSIMLSGVSGVQFGGLGGPYIAYDGVTPDTISVQSQPGALPSGDTTNFQLYPPVLGGKAFLNISAIPTPGAEERLIIGSMGGAAREYHFANTMTGTGQCRDFVFLDGVSVTPAWKMKCGNPGLGIVPQLELGYGVPISSQHPSGTGQYMMHLDLGNNQVLGEGSGINTIVLKKHIGSFGTSPTLSGCGAGAAITGGTDTKGLVTVGTAGITTCTVAFATPYTTTPAITLTGVNSTTLLFWLSDINSSGFTFAAGNGAVAMDGAGVIYHVIQ